MACWVQDLLRTDELPAVVDAAREGIGLCALLEGRRALAQTIRAVARELFIPQMLNLQAVGGVSFKKGCYTGQEIVARTHYLGKVKRHLFRLKSLQALVAGAELHC